MKLTNALRHIREFVSGMMGVHNEQEHWQKETEEFLNELFPHAEKKPKPAKRRTRKVRR